MKTRIVTTLILGAVAAGIAVPAAATGPLFGDGKSHHWGVITRNTIGSPVADLRDGPFVKGPNGNPPFGNGSLGIEVSDNSTTLSPPSEKVDFGNEVDFIGDPVLALKEVGFRVFQTGENAAISLTNLPVIRFEIDPNLQSPADGTPDYATLVWTPAAVPPASINKWSGYLDAARSGQWFLTGAEGAAVGCNQTTTCTFTQLKTKLGADPAPAPTILSIAVGKGRDNRWVGAVDGLRLNNTIYDFEKSGVRAKNVYGRHR